MTTTPQQNMGRIPISSMKFSDAMTPKQVNCIELGVMMKLNVGFHPEAIIKLVCEHYQISPDELRSKRRFRKFAYPRQMAATLIHKYFTQKLSNDAIGQLIK